MGENGGGEYKDETVRHSFSATINSLLCWVSIHQIARKSRKTAKKKRSDEL